MGIGSFLWYWLERTRASARRSCRTRRATRPRAATSGRSTRPAASRVEGPIERGPVRMALLYDMGAAPHAEADQGVRRRRAGAARRRSRTSSRARQEPLRAVARARRRVPRRDRRARRRGLQAHPARGPRRVDAAPLGRQGLRAGSARSSTARSPTSRAREGVALLHGQRVGQQARGHDRRRLPRGRCRTTTTSRSTRYVLDFACREMEDADLLRELPADKKVARRRDRRAHARDRAPRAGRRAHPQGARHIEPERVTLTTDCGLKQLPRVVAVQKLRALVEGAAIVRRELEGTS